MQAWVVRTFKRFTLAMIYKKDDSRYVSQDHMVEVREMQDEEFMSGLQELKDIVDKAAKNLEI